MLQKVSHPVAASVFLLQVFSAGENSAQDIKNPRRAHPLACILKTVGSDVKYVLTSPLRLTTKGGVQLFALAAITTGFVYHVDEKIDEELALEDYEFSTQPAKELAKLGQFYDDVSSVNFAAGLTAASLAGGLAFKNKKLLQTSRLLVESALLTHVFTWSSKAVLGRARPYLDHGSKDFNLFRFRGADAYKSMPSGHVSSAFALMTVIAKQYDHWWVAVPAYAFAVSVALQRMTSRNHWASDTIVGGGLGYWIASTLVQKQHRKPGSSSIYPYLRGNRVGFAMQW